MSRFGRAALVAPAVLALDAFLESEIFRPLGMKAYLWVDPANDLIAMVWTQLSPGGAVPLEARFQSLVCRALEPQR